MTPRRIPKRISTAIVNSLGAGVVPRIGLEYINVGRKDEIEALMQDLENVGDGGAAFRFVVGRYGSGKTFMLQLLRNQAMERDYVVADADLSPDRRLTGTNDAGRNTYRELMHNLSTKTRPDGGALAAILERWIANVQTQVMREQGLDPDSPRFERAVQAQIYRVIDDMEGMVHGFDYAKVIAAYWEGHVINDDARKDAALRWLRGEFTTKTEARHALGVRVIVTDDDWYEYVKLFAKFVASIGYRGLVVLIDEAVNLYKISHSVSRNNNYEKLLTMFNDTMQGKAQHLNIVVGGTPRFVEDTRRGLFSYEALATRLAQSRFVSNGLRDVSGPVIRLNMLDHTEIFLLLQRIWTVYQAQYTLGDIVSDSDLRQFMQAIVNRLGADQLLTPREVVRDFVGVLHLLRQNPEMTVGKIVGDEGFRKPAVKPASTDDFAEFTL
jgi:hypothetical protein